MRNSFRFTFAALICLTLPTPDWAKNRPTVDDPNGDTCFGDPEADTNCGSQKPAGLICYCCYDDGCWICGNSPLEKCVWDPKYSRSKRPIKHGLPGDSKTPLPTKPVVPVVPKNDLRTAPPAVRD